MSRTEPFAFFFSPFLARKKKLAKRMSLLLTKTCQYAVLVAIEDGKWGISISLTHNFEESQAVC